MSASRDEDEDMLHGLLGQLMILGGHGGSGGPYTTADHAAHRAAKTYFKKPRTIVTTPAYIKHKAAMDRYEKVYKPSHRAQAAASTAAVQNQAIAAQHEIMRANALYREHMLAHQQQQEREQHDLKGEELAARHRFEADYQRAPMTPPGSPKSGSKRDRWVHRMEQAHRHAKRDRFEALHKLSLPPMRIEHNRQTHAWDEQGRQMTSRHIYEDVVRMAKERRR
jgi:hypothetical protein